MKYHRGDKVWIMRQRGREGKTRLGLEPGLKVVFVEYDDDEREYAVVAYPNTRHLGRVPTSWLAPDD